MGRTQHEARGFPIFWETFDAFEHAQIRHLMSLRCNLPRETLDAWVPRVIGAAGGDPTCWAEGEQVHGAGVAVVERAVAGRCAGVDALVTATPGLTLVVRVADCGPVYFHDPVRRLIGLAHSGRKGTEQNIVAATIAAMTRLGSSATHIRVFLGPCIRPPHYEVDFARAIGEQAHALGVDSFIDCGLSTAATPERYYSYRREKGQTGRLWAMLRLN
jgi:polyphenol oxidase